MMRSAIGLLACFACLTAVARADDSRGAEILRTRGCVSCHAIRGFGGSSAPDLGLERPKTFHPAEFAASLWNHAPRMWESMRRQRMEIPLVSAEESRELYAYFERLWRLEPVGVASFGSDVWRENGCFRCHAIAGEEASYASAVKDWEELPDPLAWVAAMWNHAGPMAEEFDRVQGVWPYFTIQELADLMAYVENRKLLAPQPPDLTAEDARAGAEVFRRSECGSCHVFGRREAGKVDLSEAAVAMGLTELAVEMWNHGPLMSQSPSLERVELPKLEREEMGAVLAYVTAESYARMGGDALRGARLLADKRCLDCHGQAGEAPPIRLGGEPLSVMDFAAAVWRHGPDMLDEMKLNGVDWPQLSAQEVRDILARVNQ